MKRESRDYIEDLVKNFYKERSRKMQMKKYLLIVMVVLAGLSFSCAAEARRIRSDFSPQGLFRELTRGVPDGTEAHLARDIISSFLSSENKDIEIKGLELIAKSIEPLREIAISRLLELSKDREWDVRQAAAQALGALGIKEERVINRLLELSRDSDLSVRQAAAQALETLILKDLSSLLLPR